MRWVPASTTCRPVSRGLVKAHVQRFALDAAGDAYDALGAGELEGRAVIVP